MQSWRPTETETKPSATQPARRPVTDEEWAKEAARFGPATNFAKPKKVRASLKLRTASGVELLDVAALDEHSFSKHGAISPLADIVLGKGSDYNAANTFGEPYWWQDDSFAVHFGFVSKRVNGKTVLVEPTPPFQFGAPSWWLDDPPRFRGEERRWVLYSLGFRRRNWTRAQGKAAEARGVEIAATLQFESQDVRWVAWDGWAAR